MVATFTPNYNIPLPDPEADVDDEFYRLEQAWTIVDTVIWLLAEAVAQKANVTHTHAMSAISGLVETLAAKMPADRTFSLDDLTDVDGAAGAAINYVLVKNASGQWVPSSAAAAIGNHQHGTGDIVGLTAAINAAISTLVGAAPELLNAIDELAAAINNDPNFAVTIMNLIAANAVQPTVNAATAKTALADADVIPLLDSAASNGLKKVTLANLITSIFKAARTIANARFDGPTFGLVFSTFRMTVAAVLTAARTITFQDRDMTVGIVRGAGVSLVGTASAEFAIPSDVTLTRLKYWDLSPSGTLNPVVQLGTAAGWQTSGYVGAMTGQNATASGVYAVVSNTGMPLAYSSDNATILHGTVEVTHLGGNVYMLELKGTYANVNSVTTQGCLVVALSAPMTRIRITTSSQNMDNGGAQPMWEY